MTIIAGVAGPQRVAAFNHLLILMSALRVKSGTGKGRHAAAGLWQALQRAHFASKRRQASTKT
jgi:hypothetical protein